MRSVQVAGSRVFITNRNKPKQYNLTESSRKRLYALSRDAAYYYTHEDGFTMKLPDPARRLYAVPIDSARLREYGYRGARHAVCEHLKTHDPAQIVIETIKYHDHPIITASLLPSPPRWSLITCFVADYGDLRLHIDGRGPLHPTDASLNRIIRLANKHGVTAIDAHRTHKGYHIWCGWTSIIRRNT